MSEILFLAHRIPFPPDRGDKIRSWHMLKHLSGLGRVHLGCFADDAADAAHLPALREALGGRLGEAHVEVRRTGRAVSAARALLEGKPVSLTLFDSRAMRRFVHDMLAANPPLPDSREGIEGWALSDPQQTMSPQEPTPSPSRNSGRGEIDTIFAFSGQMAQFVPEGLRQRFVMDFVDMDSAKFDAYGAAGGPLAAVQRREAKRLFAFERAVAARADASLFVSEAEAALFRARAGLADADIRAVGNGVDVDFYRPSAVPPADAPHPLLVFTGQMDYQPNVDAVRWFAAEVLPNLPGATFAIVGRNPADAVRRLASEKVIVTGAVPDPRPWLAAADVVVAPLRIARGIQNKVLEAMAMGRPVVVTPAAFEGIEAEPERDLLVADGVAAQVEAIANMLADTSRAAALGAAGRRRIEAAYRWDSRLEPLAALCLPAREARGEGDRLQGGGGVTGEACAIDPSTTFGGPPPHLAMGRQGRAA
jgi:sugar transferase (PEP-CTERM/EpsH1 system associated)